MSRRQPLPLRKLAALPLAELLDLVRAQGALVRAQLRAWREPRGRLVGVAELRDACASTSGAARRDDAERLARAVARAATYGIFRPRCLVRAIALRELLRARGIAGDVRIGVRRDAAGFAAHAWVELDGEPLGERPEVVRTLAALPDATLVLRA